MQKDQINEQEGLWPYLRPMPIWCESAILKDPSAFSTN